MAWPAPLSQWYSPALLVEVHFYGKWILHLHGVITAQLTQVVSSASTELLQIGVERFMFQAARTEFSSNSLTSTLTTVTEVSLLNGTVMHCIGEATESLTIIVAGETYLYNSFN